MRTPYVLAVAIIAALVLPTSSRAQCVMSVGLVQPESGFLYGNPTFWIGGECIFRLRQLAHCASGIALGPRARDTVCLEVGNACDEDDIMAMTLDKAAGDPELVPETCVLPDDFVCFSGFFDPVTGTCDPPPCATRSNAWCDGLPLAEILDTCDNDSDAFTDEGIPWSVAVMAGRPPGAIYPTVPTEARLDWRCNWSGSFSMNRYTADVLASGSWGAFLPVGGSLDWRDPAGMGATDFPVACAGHPDCFTIPGAADFCGDSGGVLRTVTEEELVTETAINTVLATDSLYQGGTYVPDGCSASDFDFDVSWTNSPEVGNYLREAFRLAAQVCSGWLSEGDICRAHADNVVCFSNLLTAWFSGLRSFASYHTPFTHRWRLASSGGVSFPPHGLRWERQRYRPDAVPDLLTDDGIHRLIEYVVGGAAIGMIGFSDSATGALPTSVTYCDLPNAPPFDGGGP